MLTSEYSTKDSKTADGCSTSEGAAPNVTSAIQHTVVFSLRHRSGSSAESDFLAAALALATIPGVERFEQLRQVSPKSDFAFCFSMYFAGEDAYQAYDDHPAHIAFVRDCWDAEVSDFQEFDFVPFTAAD